MSRYRLVWVKCPDCGRSGERPGGCVIVQRKGWFMWSTYLIEYGRSGTHAAHFRSQTAALTALRQSLDPVPPEFIVVKEVTL